jgi:putative membrane protein
LGYHHGCGVLLRKFEARTNPHGHVWFRWFNEIPVVILTLVVVLVVVKPF